MSIESNKLIREATDCQNLPELIVKYNTNNSNYKELYQQSCRENVIQAKEILRLKNDWDERMEKIVVEDVNKEIKDGLVRS